MNTVPKLAAGFVVGAAVGSLITYFVVRDHFQAIADEQIENMREYYIAHPPKKRESKIEKKPEGEKMENDPIKSFSSERKNYEEMAHRYRMSPQDIDLTSRIEERELDEDGDVVEIIFDPKDAREKPYLIPEESYMRDFSHIFGAEALEYWVLDNVLTVADSDEVLDILTTIGLDAVNALLNPERTSDVVYVRNEQLEMEYEVERNDRSYAEWIGGIVEVPEPPTPPKQKRRRNKYEDDGGDI